MLKPGHGDHPYLQLRPERLSVEMFMELTDWVQNQQSLSAD